MNKTINQSTNVILNQAELDFLLSLLPASWSEQGSIDGVKELRYKLHRAVEQVKA